MDSILRDLRFALRSLRRSPGLVAIATLSLALGIAVNVTIFAAVDILLFRPLPFQEPDRLVHLWSTNPSRGWDQTSISLADFRDWREQSRTMTLVAYRRASFNLSDDTEEPIRASGARVSPGFFTVLGARPALGRGFGLEEEQPGKDGVVVLSDLFWRDRFEADPGIIGRTIRLDGQMVTVVGVMEAGFDFPENAIDMWITLPLIEEDRDSRYLRVLGRLTPGVSIEAAQAELDGITRSLATTYPASNKGMGGQVIRLHDEVVEPEARQAGVICLVAVFFVLMIACANVANLLLARGAARSRELSVRAALGAGRGRLVRELLAESLVLAAIGCALGVVASFWGIGLFRSIMPSDFPRVDLLAIDGPVLLYAILVGGLAGLAFGTAPALQVTGVGLSSALAEGGRGGSTGLKHRRLRTAFVIGEVALAQVLLISAGLMIKGAWRLQNTEPGFEPRQVLAFGLTLGDREYTDTLRVTALQETILARLRELPGVEAASGITQLPMSGGSGTYYMVEGAPPPPEGERPVVQQRGVFPGIVPALGLSLVRGRDVAATDRRGTTPVTLVNEAFAKRHWPDGDPLGQRITFFGATWEIVGVVTDVREFGADDPAPPIVYYPALQRTARSPQLILRSSGDPAALAGPVREALGALAPNLPIYAVRTLEEHIQEQNTGNTIMPKLLSTFGALALLLALLGVYGVMAYTVTQRERELGIRRVLGAQVKDISWLVLGHGLRLAGIGAVIGLLIALGVTRSLSTFLLGVSAFDPVVFAGVTVSLVAATVAASTLPAKRATAVDPGVALRAE
ncbi:MAG TPA: ABC transporter permease [Gemmatimonadales bacterium]